MTRRFYVTLTWHDFPEGGSFGTIVEAKEHNEAENKAREEMAQAYTEDDKIEGYEEMSEAEQLQAEENQILECVGKHLFTWHLVDCFDLDDFIRRHNQEIHN